MTRLTVGIPFHNSRSTLGAAIESVLQQTRPADQVILVDDGSSDGSRAIAEAYVGRAVTLVSDGVNRGLIERLNQITGLATGDLMARMDADDICHPERFERQLHHLERNPHIDVLATGAWVIDENNSVVGRRHCSPMPSGNGSPLGRGLLLHPTVMAARRWYEAHPYDRNFVRAEDKELWCRTWTGSVFARLAEPLLFYRETAQLRPASYREGCRSDRRIIRRYGPRLVGRPATAALLAQALAIEGVTLLSARTPLGAAVIRLRSETVTDADRRRGQTQLDAVLTKTPA